MNWDTSIENFKNYLKLERGLSMNSIKSYEFDLIQFKNFMIENGINESPKKFSIIDIIDKTEINIPIFIYIVLIIVTLNIKRKFFDDAN